VNATQIDEHELNAFQVTGKSQPSMLSTPLRIAQEAVAAAEHQT
jgi:hypothetical protein